MTLIIYLKSPVLNFAEYIYLLNGRNISFNTNTYYGNLDLNSIPTSTIDRIELSSGSASTLYGSEAFGGVVNIITKPGS